MKKKKREAKSNLVDVVEVEEVVVFVALLLEGVRLVDADGVRELAVRLDVRGGRRQRVCRSLASVLRRPMLTEGLFSLCRRWHRLPERIVARLNHVQLPTAELHPCL